MCHHVMASLEPFSWTLRSNPGSDLTSEAVRRLRVVTLSLSSNSGSYLTLEAVRRQQLMAPVATCLFLAYFQSLMSLKHKSRRKEVRQSWSLPLSLYILPSSSPDGRSRMWWSKLLAIAAAVRGLWCWSCIDSVCLAHVRWRQREGREIFLFHSPICFFDSLPSLHRSPHSPAHPPARPPAPLVACPRAREEGRRGNDGSLSLSLSRLELGRWNTWVSHPCIQTWITTRSIYKV